MADEHEHGLARLTLDAHTFDEGKRQQLEAVEEDQEDEVNNEDTLVRLNSPWFLNSKRRIVVPKVRCLDECLKKIRIHNSSPASRV
jgi:hypothetical protein